MTSVVETYQSADGKGKRILKGIFMPHTLLKKSDEQKAKEQQKANLMQRTVEDSKQSDADAKKRNKTMMLAIGGIVVVGLGVGLYFAFKK